MAWQGARAWHAKRGLQIENLYRGTQDLLLWAEDLARGQLVKL